MATKAQIEARAKNTAKGIRITKETARERQKASVEARFKNKTGAELANAILASELKGEELKELQERLGTSEKLTQEAAMDAAMARAAKSGNPQAYDKLLRKAGIMVDKQIVGIDGFPERMKPSDAIDYVAQLNK